jgi:hypothetical protein
MKRWKLGGEEAGKMEGNGIGKAGKGRLSLPWLWGVLTFNFFLGLQKGYFPDAFPEKALEKNHVRFGDVDWLSKCFPLIFFAALRIDSIPT